VAHALPPKTMEEVSGDHKLHASGAQSAHSANGASSALVHVAAQPMHRPKRTGMTLETTSSTGAGSDPGLASRAPRGTAPGQAHERQPLLACWYSQVTRHDDIQGGRCDR
jgi:hypothetical protein